MAVDPLTNLAIAVRNQVGRELYDYADTYHSMASVFRALDNMYGVTSRVIKSTDVTGYESQINFRASLPTVQGVNSVTGNLSSLELPTQSNFSIVGGKMPWSHYHSREDIRKAFITHLSGDKAKMVKWVEDISKAMRDAYIKQYSDDWFPSVQVTASVGNASESKMMAVPYPLQNPSGTYEYLGINLNATGYTGLKATVSGSNAVAFGAPTLSNIRKNILLPLRKKSAEVDMVICDSATFDYILTQAEAKVVLEQAKQLEYGGEYVRYAGRIWVLEHNLDDLYAATGYREIYFLDSSTWQLTQTADDQNSWELLQHPDAPTLKTLLGETTNQLACFSPRRNGRAVNVTIS